MVITQCAEIAGRLHVIHQFALWLMRLLGLRIGEAYGILVGDILDQGPGLPGAVTLRAQGGRKYQTRGAAASGSYRQAAPAGAYPPVGMTCCGGVVHE